MLMKIVGHSKEVYWYLDRLMYKLIMPEDFEYKTLNFKIQNMLGMSCVIYI
jgi:hypothetical protein